MSGGLSASVYTWRYNAWVKGFISFEAVDDKVKDILLSFPLYVLILVW